MADSVTLEFRGVYLEDLGVSSTPDLVTTTILGLGSGIAVTPIVSAADDTGATSAGLGIGDVYLESGVIPNRLRANGGSGSGTVTKLRASATIVGIGEILDGGVLVLSTTLSITGALLGDPVEAIGVNPPLPAGVMAFGKVTSAGVVTIEIWNNSEIPVIPGTGVYTAVIIH